MGRITRVTLLLLLLIACAPVQAQLVSAVLPTSRSVQVGGTATAFATIINAGTTTATGCSISPATSIPATFLYQTTNPTTNAVTGTANTPVTIGPGVAQSFVIAFTPTAAFASTDVQLSFSCTNTSPAPTMSGLNTLLLTASAAGAPDIVALAATTGGDGVLGLPSATGAAAFAVATINLGAQNTITVSADTNAVTLPVAISICQTSASAACIGTPASTVSTTIAANAKPTFGIFVAGTDNVALLPGANRIRVRFTASNGTVVGSTGVAVRTLGYNPPAPSTVAFTRPLDPLPGGMVGQAYSYCFCSPAPSIPNGLCGFPTQGNPSGGNPPYHFQLDSGVGFPPIGVVLLPNGCLSGTPSAAGSDMPFSVCAIDLNGAQVCRQNSITIQPASAPPTGTYYWANWNCGSSSQCAAIMGGFTGSTGQFCTVSDCDNWRATYFPGASCSVTSTFTRRTGDVLQWRLCPVWL